MKEQLHPGKILGKCIREDGYVYEEEGGDLHADLSCIDDAFTCNGDLYDYINECDLEEIKDLIIGKRDISLFIASKLSQFVPGTDVRFWFKLQENYDNYQDYLKDKDKQILDELKSIYCAG